MSVLKPKIMRSRLSPVLSKKCKSETGCSDETTAKTVLSLTLPPAKTNLERLRLRQAQIIYSSSYAGQLFRSLPAPPEAFRHRHGTGSSNCRPFVVDRPA